MGSHFSLRQQQLPALPIPPHLEPDAQVVQDGFFGQIVEVDQVVDLAAEHFSIGDHQGLGLVRGQVVVLRTVRTCRSAHRREDRQPNHIEKDHKQRRVNEWVLHSAVQSSVRSLHGGRNETHVAMNISQGACSLQL